MGFADYCRPDAVILIEWADKVLPALNGIDYIRIDLSHEGPTDRKIRISNLPGRF
jgi:tRNA A37 threonylcarbamoyladenosine biosynthesis protein TsaE